MDGELLIGTVVTLSCPEVTEVLAGAGFDWLFIDAEHSPLEAREEYVDAANERIAVIVQAEHVDAADNIETIVSVPGIDCVLVGPYDLSASLGRLGQVNHPEVIDAIGRVTRACQEAGVRLGIFGASPDAVRPYIEQGFTLIAVGGDTLMLGQAAKRVLAEL